MADGMTHGTTDMPDIGEVTGDGLITITTTIITQDGMADGTLIGGMDTDTMAAAVTTARTDTMVHGTRQSETSVYLQARLSQDAAWVQAAAQVEAS